MRVEVLVISIFFLTSCVPVRQADAYTPPMPTLPAATAAIHLMDASPSQPTVTTTPFLPLILKAPAISELPPIVSFQVQYTGTIDTSIDVDVFNLDLFDTPPATIQALRERGIFVMCYFSAGSYEDWRPDTDKFPLEVLGKDMAGWPGEKWLDVRRRDILGPIMEERLDLAVERGCDGVDPDNVNGYENDTGFPLTDQDQLVYNRFLSAAAHERGLAIGLKNDLEQIIDLVPYFDWIINEECFSYQECHLLYPFKRAGKPVFVIEYELAPEEFCPQANQMGFNGLVKHWELDAYRIDCHQFLVEP